MLVDFDDVFVEHALKHGYVSADQIADAKKQKKKELDGGRRYYLGQILIKQRALSCGDFLEIEPEPRLAVRRIGSVARKAPVGQDRADVAVEFDLLRRKHQGGGCEKGKPAEHSIFAVYTPVAVSSSSDVLFANTYYNQIAPTLMH